MALSDSDIQFVDRCYGKNYVRLLHVKRVGRVHHVKEIEVNTALTLDDTVDFLNGNNSKIVATDSQKNTVYILAKKHGVKSIEDFGLILSQHFLNKYDQVTHTRIYVEEKPWKRIQQGGVAHNHAFIASGDAVRSCFVTQAKHALPKLKSGIKHMKVMKTTQSSFTDFVNDEFRSLPDANDRVFCTIVDAVWEYDSKAIAQQECNFDHHWESVKNSILDVFGGPPDTGVFSPSVQKTLYDGAKMVLAKIPQVTNISIELPNVHAYEFDLKKYPAFGFKENQEVFQPTDKPSGNIKATLQRNYKSKI